MPTTSAFSDNLFAVAIARRMPPLAIPFLAKRSSDRGTRDDCCWAIASVAQKIPMPAERVVPMHSLGTIGSWSTALRVQTSRLVQRPGRFSF